ncbi:MAG: hypothetical protein V3T43_02905 [Nitrosomonadaceae bacterium]
MSENEGFFLGKVSNNKTGLAPTDLTAVFYGDQVPETPESPKARMISWTVTDADKELDSFEFLLANDDLRLFDMPLFRKGNEIIFQFGTRDNLSRRYKGVISSRTGWRTIKISGRFKSEIAISNSQATEKFENMKISEIAEKLFEREGLTAFVDDTKIKLNVVIKRDETVLQFLKRKAGEIGGAYEVYVENEKGYFVKKDFTQRASMILRYATEKRESDYKTIGEPSYQDVQDNKATEETIKGFDVLEKKAIKSKGNNETSEQTSLGGGTAVFDASIGGFKFKPKGANKSEDTGKGKPTAKQKKNQADEEAKSKFDKKNTKAFKLGWKIEGDASVNAKILAEVDTDSTEISGLWYVEKVTHKCVGGAYDTDLAMVRNASGKVDGLIDATPKAGTNKKKADEEAKNKQKYRFNKKTGKFGPVKK